MFIFRSELNFFLDPDSSFVCFKVLIFNIIFYVSVSLIRFLALHPAKKLAPRLLMRLGIHR